MQLHEKCPSCNDYVVFNQMHRTFIEKTLRKEHLKFKCVNCSAEIFSHRSHREIRLHREGVLSLDE